MGDFRVTSFTKYWHHAVWREEAESFQWNDFLFEFSSNFIAAILYIEGFDNESGKVLAGLISEW